MSRQTRSETRHASRKQFPLHWLQRFGLLPVIALMALLAPFVPAPPSSVRWHGAQAVCVEVGAALLLTALLCRPWRVSSARFLLRQPPFAFLFLLLLWGLISCLSSPSPFAVQGLLLLGVGTLVAGVTAAQAVNPSRVLLVTACVLLPAVLVALTGFAQIGEGKTLAVGVLSDHQLFGAFLLLPIPLCLALSLAPGAFAQRTAGLAALLFCTVGLWESQNRSAWLGTLAALAAFTGFRLYAASNSPAAATGSRRGSEKWQSAVVPGLLGIVALAGFFLIAPNQDQLFARMRSTNPVMHGRDESLRWRKIVWIGTRRMIAEKPLGGWGVGSFPLRHEPFTHTGHPAGVAWEQGPSIEDEAHDSYLQMWAELGIGGLLLWLGAFFSLLGRGVQALRRLKRGSVEQWLLVGGMAAVTGQMADALANPAWEFGNVALPLWIVFGLTAALSAAPGKMSDAHKSDAPASAYAPLRRGIQPTVQIAVAVGIGAGLLWLIWRTAFALPAPHL